VETDGPATVVITNEGDVEFGLAIKRGDDTYTTGSESKYNIAAQAQVVWQPPDGVEVNFVGVLHGGAAVHPTLHTGADGVTSPLAVTRRMTSAAATFLADGVRDGDVLEINDTPGDDDGTYIVTVINATTVDVERDWPNGNHAALAYNVYKRCCIMPRSFRMNVVHNAANVTITDNGSGILYGVLHVGPPIAAVTGTLDYFTGKWTIACAAGHALDNLSAITVTYSEMLPCVPGGKISFPIHNVRRGDPLSFYAVGAADTCKARVKVFVG
jgi:hypothetical protein